MGRVRKTCWAVSLALAATGVSGSAEAAPEICMRLEARLMALDSRYQAGGVESYRRHDRAVQKQREELDRATAEARRAGCIGGSLFRQLMRGSANCSAVMANLNRMRARLGRMTAARDSYSDDPFSSGRERGELVSALAANRCGDQYEAFDRPARRHGLFATLFGGRLFRGRGWGNSYRDSDYGTFRTLCVRSCDGYYFPISFSTVSSRFAADEQACRARCPGTDVALYVHRNPGEDADQMISLAGEPYTALPTAFRYRQAYDRSCTCGRVAAVPPAFEAVAGLATPAGGDPWFYSGRAPDPWGFARGSGAPGPSGGVPPFPRHQPDAGEDPETVANRGGGLVPKFAQPRAAAVAGLGRDGQKTVRIVGPSYYYAQ